MSGIIRIGKMLGRTPGDKSGIKWQLKYEIDIKELIEHGWGKLLHQSNLELKKLRKRRETYGYNMSLSDISAFKIKL